MTQPPKMKSIASGSLSARAYEALREGLIDGNFRPGQRLVMQDLANLLGTSITPVREAALRLVSEGGLDLRSGRFVIVPEMSLERYLEVRAMRIELEGLAARVAAERVTDDALTALIRVQKKYAASSSPEHAPKAQKHNREFHAGLYRMSRMPLLISHIDSLWVSMGPMLARFFDPDEHQYFGAEIHDEIIEALKCGDGEKAEKLIQSDILNGSADFLRMCDAHDAWETLN